MNTCLFLSLSQSERARERERDENLEKSELPWTGPRENRPCAQQTCWLTGVQAGWQLLGLGRFCCLVLRWCVHLERE